MAKKSNVQELEFLDGLCNLKEDTIGNGNSDFPNPELLTWYKDYKDRVLWIDKDIDESLFDEVRLIMQWNREDSLRNIPAEERKPITLIVHSFGGDLDAAFALIDTMNASKTPIRTVNINCALSAGSLIVINGTPGMRYCFPLSQILIHNGSGANSGTFEAVAAQTENYKKLINMMQQNIMSHSNFDQKTFNKIKGKETYLYADEQIKFGLCDHIITSLEDIF